MQKVTREGNVGSKWSEKKMEGEDALRTVESLRGRLLAERISSRNAKQEADQIGNKLIEMEVQLKEEINSRNRAEKKLKFLLKKLETRNISYVSDDSKQSGSLDKSEMTSVFSSASSTTNEAEVMEPSALITSTVSVNCHNQGLTENTNYSIFSKNLNQNVSKSFSRGHDSSADEEISGCRSESRLFEFVAPKCHSEGSIQNPNSSMTSNNFEQNPSECTSFEALSERSSELESREYSNDSKTDDQSLKASVEGKEVIEDNDQGQHHIVDNSMALVPVDFPKMEQTTNPAVLDARVKEALNSLQLAKLKLQISMEQRRVIRVG